MNTAVADPLLGRLLEGRYLIRAQLARGGMSTVYTAMDERLDRLVAVKVMSAALSADPAFTDRFIREARAAARLTHVNAVAVFDQGEDTAVHGRLVFLVMELVSGRTLRDLLRERGRLTPAEALSVIDPVLTALAAAHRAGLVHRDIKPENILISDDGVVKVADFGLARAIESDGNTTATGVMMGTVAYCSPEQISRGRTDARSDVYATGIVLFELLTGTAPYVGESAVNVAFQHVHNRVPVPSSRARGIDPLLDELVSRATDNDPAGRPMDAGAFLAELTDVRDDLDLPIVAVPGPATTASPNRRASGRARGAGTATGRIDALGGVGTDEHPTGRISALRSGVHNTRAVDPHVVDEFIDEGPPPPVVIPPAKPRRQRSVRSRRRRRALLVFLIVALLGFAAGYGSWWYASGRYGRVPTINGQSQQAALAALSKAGFRLAPGGVQLQFSDTVKKDMVISSDPSGGARVPHSQRVVLVISKGKDVVTIPTVAVGSSQTEAKSLLGTVPIELNPVSTSQASDTVPAGAVLGTNPAGGTSVERDGEVTLVVSSGPPVLTVPEETSKDQRTATADLTKAGFKVKVAFDFSSIINKGQVISESPVGDSQLAKFQTVTITVSKGPAPVVLPQIASLTPYPDAKATLEELGLVVKENIVYGGLLNKVLGMSPKAGTLVPYGSTVTLDVA